MLRLTLLLYFSTVFCDLTTATDEDTTVVHNETISLEHMERLTKIARFDDHEDVCKIRKEWSMAERCIYVTVNSDSCEGGGYTLWTRYVFCTQSVVARVFVYIGSFVYLIVLFIHISVTADDFFSPAIAAIVAQLKISENIAGVTFLAFGNGAPDIFGSIASILSTPTPKAGLALGSLLGGTLYVTTIVLGTIIFKAKSFRVNIISSIREYIFYSIATGWILFIFLRGNTVVLFEPLVDLGIYIIYVVVVIALRIIQNRLKSRRLNKKKNQDIKDSTEVNEKKMQCDSESLPESSSDVIEDEEEEDGTIVIIGHHVLLQREAFSTIIEPDVPTKSTWIWKDTIDDICSHFDPRPDKEEWVEANIIEKIFTIVKIPSQLVLKASVPLYESKWIKPLTMLHLLLAPSLILGALQYWTTSPFHGSPPLFVYGIGVSVILIAIVFIFTRIDSPPKFHREIASYFGFILSIAWIYLASSEIVGVISMIGVASGLSFEFLGLTILAWSNSIGDFFADLSVVKQGFPRMAFAAATGGPLFNLLVGFGLPFTIATAKGSRVSIAFTSQLRIIIIFIYVSIMISTFALLIQRFTITRWHGFALFAVYIVFFVLVILFEAKVIVWM